MQKTSRFHRLLALLLVVATLFSTFAVTAQAASISDGSKSCTIGKRDRHTYLKTTAGTSLGGSGYTYKTNDGITGTAYCINWGLALTSKSLEITGRYTASPKTIGAFANGYPQRSVADFLNIYGEKYPAIQELTQDEYLYATQAAIWATLGQIAVQGTAFTKGRATIAKPTGGTAQQLRVFTVIEIILHNANGWTKPLYTGMYVSSTENTLAPNVELPADFTLENAADAGEYGIEMETIDGTDYFTRTFSIASATSTWPNDYAIHVWAENAPEGTIFVGEDNAALTRSTYEGQSTFLVPTTQKTTSRNANGAEYSGLCKLAIPVDSAGDSGNITIRAAGTITQFDIYLAYNPVSTEQSYIISDPGYNDLSARGTLAWGGAESNLGRLVVSKVDGVGNPLEKTEFRLEGSDGSYYTGTTNGNGEIVFEELNASASYVLTETKAPAGFGIVEPTSVSVQVNRTSYVTVQDTVEKQLIVKKTDKQNGYSLQGAVFVFEQINGSFRTTATTGHDGTIQFTEGKLPVGSYRVYEVSAPEGYEKDTSVQTVHWTADKDVRLSFENVRKPTLIVYKEDADTGDVLSGAVFDIYKDGKRITSVKTDDAGLAYVNGISEGYYEAVETAAPEGYVIDSTRHGIHIDPYNPASEDDPILIIPNSAKPGLQIVKYDAQTMAGVAGVSFEVYRDTELIGTYTTDSDGEIYISGLEPGTYLAKEIAATDDYVVNSTPQQIELSAGGGIARLVFLNYLKPGIHLTKLDSQTMQPLVNATFLIEQVGGTYSKEFTTDENGEIDLSKLTPGAYTVTETKAPDGYLIDAATRIIQINEGENAQFVFTDTQKPSLSVVKYDPNTGKNLAGAVFRIAKIEDGSHYLDRVSDVNGQITIDNLEPGIYSVQEISAPEGYILNRNEYHVELFPGKTSQLVVSNEAKPDLLIVKQDAATGERLAGASFTVRKADSETVTTVTTDENGEALLTDMDTGAYVITETVAPQGYLLNEDAQMITLVPNKTGTVVFENYPKPVITIVKLDSITKDPIQGAKFDVWYASNATFTGELNHLGEYYTDEDGQIVLSGLKDGWYKVEEVQPADGYELPDTTVQTYYVKAGTGKVFTFENTPLSGLVIKKVDADSGEVLQGAKFQVRYFSGVSGTGGTVIGEYTTSANGTVVLNRLKAGTYIVEEIKAPAGYEITEAAKTIYITGEEQAVVTVEFADKAIGDLKIVKLDENTRQPISGVTFEICRMNGEYIGTYTTDKNGSIILNTLEDGWYSVVETKAAKGYRLDAQPRSIEVKDGQTAYLEITNAKTAHILIHKVDAKTGEGIYGATFLLYDGSKNPIGEYVSDQDGYVYIDDDLEDGRYYLREIKAADGYLADDTLKTVYVRYGATTEIKWENTAVKGQIQIIKKSVDYNPNNGLPAGSLLSGAVFEIYDKAGNVVDTIKTDKNGRAVSRLLPLSRYTIREVKAPAFYSANPTQMTAYLEYEGQIITFEVENDSVNTGVSIHKTGYAEVMSNAPIKYTLTGIGNTGNVALDNFYWRDTLPAQVRLDKIVTGTYNQGQNYKVVYKTNLNGGYRTLADSLSTTKNHVLDASRTALGLASNERIVEVMFIFGTVRPGFAQVETPMLYATTISGLANKSQFVNVADVGGTHNGVWVQAVSRWVTTVYAKTTVTLPKTGY